METHQKAKFLTGYVPFSTDPYVFDVDDYIQRAVPDPEMLKYPETRRELTRANPLLFAMLYLPHHLKTPTGEMTFSKFHLDLYKWASATWHIRPGLTDARDAFLAPRGAGKSSTLFLTLLMWAACHGFIKFVAGYSDSESTVKNHFDTFKEELKENALIMRDYPRMNVGANTWTKDEIDAEGMTTVKDTAMFLKTSGRFVFAVRSISSNSLGLKVGPRRPDFILLDDVERAEGDYSVLQAEKRLESITGGILAQSQPAGARVVLVGTNLMIGSIIDGMIKYSQGHESAPGWIKAANFRVHWYRPFIRRDDGSKQSFWPGMWSTEFLLDQEKVNDKFGMNFDNQPQAKSGAFWEEKDFEYGSIPKHLISFGILSLDPAVTSTRKSDFSAFAVVLYSKALDRYEVAYSYQAKLTPGQIREKVEQLCSNYPEITTVYIETTQGGDTWMEILKDIPVRVKQEKPKVSKQMRAEWTLNVYQKINSDGSRGCLHRTKFVDLEAQMKAFPHTGHDDLVDSVTQAVCVVEAKKREDGKNKRRRPLKAASLNRRR